MIDVKNLKKIKHQVEYVGARITTENKKALESKCKALECSVSTLIAELIDNFLKENNG